MATPHCMCENFYTHPHSDNLSDWLPLLLLVPTETICTGCNKEPALQLYHTDMLKIKAFIRVYNDPDADDGGIWCFGCWCRRFYPGRLHLIAWDKETNSYKVDDRSRLSTFSGLAQYVYTGVATISEEVEKWCDDVLGRTESEN